MFAINGTILKVGMDVEIYDWKTERNKFIKPPRQWHFAFAKMKRMIITKNSKDVVLVRGEAVYNSNIRMEKKKKKKKERKKNTTRIRTMLTLKETTYKREHQLLYNKLVAAR